MAITATAAIRAREAESGGHIPIIAMTANAMQGDHERCLQAGMDAYIRKPMRLAPLAAMVEKWVRYTSRVPLHIAHPLRCQNE